MGSDLRQRPRIGVMGPGVCSGRSLQLARDVGFEIARGGAILVCGGMGGVMEAAARGAREGGGITIGILPGARAEDANQYVDIPVATDLGNARNVVNILTSQAIIAIHGGYGTLSEIALALKCGTPVVGLETWDMKPPGGASAPEMMIAKTPQEAVAIAIRISKAHAAARPEV
jgi:uncharacterized protein (TIGR00725 family)